jgi:hypothetical protein
MAGLDIVLKQTDKPEAEFMRPALLIVGKCKMQNMYVLNTMLYDSNTPY